LILRDADHGGQIFVIVVVRRTAYQKNPQAKVSDIVAETGMPKSRISRSLSKLKAAGVLSREGSKKYGEWMVNRKG